jgi:hypothetical protein
VKMDSAIPVEVARFRTREGLVYREVCGSTGHTCALSAFRRAPQPLIKTQRPAFLWMGTRVSADFRSDFQATALSSGPAGCQYICSGAGVMRRSGETRGVH